MLDSLHEGCQVIGFDLRYLYVNDAVAAQGRTTKDELLGRTMIECYPGIDQTPMFERLQRCLRERKHDRMENEFTFPDGSQGWFELRFIPVSEGVCVLSLDITGTKRVAAALARSEAQFRHAQKMEAVGRLAGGVAHDFNNLLSVILSYASILIEDLAEDDPIRADLTEIKTASERAAALTRQLLAFSRHQPLQFQVLDLNEVVLQLEGMLRRLLTEDVRLHCVAAGELGRVRADRGQLEQVLMNLVVNAHDAMPNGGTLTIETRNVDLDEEYAAEHLGTTPGPHVLIAVSDTGIGMDGETQERAFEPFFTTKDAGKGTGLGLSTVFGIIQQSGGHIWLYSEEGRGTTFKIYFPRCDEAAPVRTSSAPPPPVRGSATILLVEDNDQVRRVARDILIRDGYEVLVAHGGAEAISLSEEHDGPIHLLLTDVIMPNMSGGEVAERLRTVRPALSVLYMSGYTDDALVQHRVLEQGALLLQKPITPTNLLRKVREVIEGAGGSG